jgi:hypothetical protein
MLPSPEVQAGYSIRVPLCLPLLPLLIPNQLLSLYLHKEHTIRSNTDIVRSSGNAAAAAAADAATINTATATTTDSAAESSVAPDHSAHSATRTGSSAKCASSSAYRSENNGHKHPEDLLSLGQ